MTTAKRARELMKSGLSMVAARRQARAEAGLPSQRNKLHEPGAISEDAEKIFQTFRQMKGRDGRVPSYQLHNGIRDWSSARWRKGLENLTAARILVLDGASYVEQPRKKWRGLPTSPALRMRWSAMRPTLESVPRVTIKRGRMAKKKEPLSNFEKIFGRFELPPMPAHLRPKAKGSKGSKAKPKAERHSVSFRTLKRTATVPAVKQGPHLMITDLAYWSAMKRLGLTRREGLKLPPGVGVYEAPISKAEKLATTGPLRGRIEAFMGAGMSAAAAVREAQREQANEAKGSKAKRSKASKPKAKKASKRRPADKLEAAKKGPEIIRRRAAPVVTPRAFMKDARAKRRAELAEVRTTCKAGRVAVRTRYRDRFEKLKAALRRSLERAQRDHLADCKARRALIDSTFKAKAERAAQHKAERKRAAEERAHLRAKRGTTLKQIKALGRARDSRGEQLDRARYEVETQAPNMLALFDRVKRKLKLRPGFSSLAEVFFQFAHDNPEEVIASAQAKANKSAAAEIRAMAKGTRFERISGTICNKAARAFKSGRAFHLKAREEAALRAIGADPDRLMSTCYPRRRRVVSGREYRGTSKASEAPF